jgi:hypothetical protein
VNSQFRSLSGGFAANLVFALMVFPRVVYIEMPGIPGINPKKQADCD